ncbi:hypothetical protein ACJRO7_026641 [Eucalyptus globulus]|uniref:Disease resistance protein At4g27190-like leucine-rich repeats domain-containing protein n=1 Tax=Eucalyptus globulus TaxID=34317 RepID=A0ABD3JUT9_EUCGL
MVGLLGLEKILHSEPSIKFSGLKSLKIEESKSTLSIPKDWILKLPNLESMEIAGSPSAEVVFDLEELKVAGEVEILSQLSTLALSKLSNLRRMLKQDVQLQGILIFQNLKELSVRETGLSFLFSVSMAKCLREIRDIKVEDCPNMKTVIVDEEGTYDIIELPLLKRLSITRCPIEKFFSYPHGKKELVTTTSDSRDPYFDSFFDQKVSLPSLEELKLKSGGSFKGIWHSELMENSLCKLATLSIGYCSKLHNVFPSTIIGRLHNLTIVEIENCPSLESLFDCGSIDANTAQTTILLPKSEVQTVRDTRKLKCTVKSDSQTILGFPSLKKVRVCSCSNLRYLFPSCMATTLEKLKSLWISNCEQMKEVVPKETAKGDDESLQPLFNEMVCFIPYYDHSYSCISYFRMILLSHIILVQARFPNIRKLQIEGAKCKELWNNQIPNDSFCKLELLRVEHCDNLLCIAPSPMWKRLQLCLAFLEVRSCRLIKIIYESDGTNTKSGKMTRLVLRDLENLRHIWQSNGFPNVPFPNLRYVEVVRCSRLEMLFTTFTTKFLGQIKELVVESCEDLELIAGHEECEEAAGTTITFSELTALRLFELPKIRAIQVEKDSVEFPSLQHLCTVSCGTVPDQGLDDWESYQACKMFDIEEMLFRLALYD